MSVVTVLGGAGLLGLSLKTYADNWALKLELAGIARRLQQLEIERLPAAQSAPRPTPPTGTIPAAESVIPVTPPSRDSAQARPSPAPAPQQPRILPENWERLLVEHWLVWVGGLAMALGGAFLVKLSIDYGLLTPIVRVVLAACLGLVLLEAAEWARRSDRPQAASHVGAALAASSVSVLFADVYAAHALYGMLPSFAAFVLLAIVAAAGLVLSLRYGALVAILGLLGAYAVPLLVESASPASVPLFAYLAVVTVAATALIGHRGWDWLGWPVLACAIGWPVLWLAGPYAPSDTPVLGLYLMLMMGAFAALCLGLKIGPIALAPPDSVLVRPLVRTGFFASAATMVVLVITDGFHTGSLIWLFTSMVATMALALRDDALDDLLVPAALPPLLVLACWPVFTTKVIWAPLDAVNAGRFEWTAFATAAVAGIGGFLALARVARPGRWAAFATATPLTVLAIAYVSLTRWQPGIGWGTIGLALAGCYLLVAGQVRKRDDPARLGPALAAFAIGTLSAISLAAAMMLREAWLTVALALELPILAWVDGRIRLPILRWIAIAVASVVLLRLAANPEIVDYPLAGGTIVNWLLYGFGVPALAFAAARQQFRPRGDDLLVQLLEAGAVVFGTALVTFELRHWLSHATIDLALDDLGRDSAETVLWLVLAGILFDRGGGRPVLAWSAIVLFLLATLQAVLWQALAANPVLTGQGVGNDPLLDPMLIAYAAPALLYGAIAAMRLGPLPIQLASRALAIGFLLLWLTLEVRHGFQGAVLSGPRVSEAEWYSYSVAWLVVAMAFVGAGIASGGLWLRKVGLAGIGLVVLKVFLSDAGDLSGIWRALSFIGLGATLIGLGYAYRALVPADTAQPDQPVR